MLGVVFCLFLLLLCVCVVSLLLLLVCVWVWVHVRVCACVCMHSCARTCMYTRVRAHTRTCVHVCLHACVPACVPACVCVKTVNKNFLSMTSVSLQGIWVVTLQQRQAMQWRRKKFKKMSSMCKTSSVLAQKPVPLPDVDEPARTPHVFTGQQTYYHCRSHMNTSTHKKKTALSVRGSSSLV